MGRVGHAPQLEHTASASSEQRSRVCRRLTAAPALLLLYLQCIAAAPRSLQSLTAALPAAPPIERLRVRPPHHNYRNQTHRPKHVPAVRPSRFITLEPIVLQI